MSLADNFIAYRILTKLVTPFVDTDAFKNGIIDKDGNVIKKPKTSAEEKSYSALDRIVFSLKKVIEKFAGKSKLSSLGAAYWLLSEATNYNDELETRLIHLIENDISILESEIKVISMLEELSIAANNTSGVEVKNPGAIPKKKKFLKDILKRKENPSPDMEK